MSEQTAKPNFSMKGAPHKPLQFIHHSEHLQGFVASTGNSSLARVCEDLEVFGGTGYVSPKQEHWESLLDRYFDELDALHWQQTGRHLVRRNGKVRRPHRGGGGKRVTVKVDMKLLLSLAK